MKIEAIILKNFLDKVTLGGEIGTAILEFTPEGLKVQVIDTMKVVGVSGLLKGVTSDIDKLPIKDTSKLIDALNLFNKEVQLTKKDNRLFIVDAKKEVELVLSSEEFVENKMDDFPAIPYATNVQLSPDIFTATKQNSNLLKDTSSVVRIKDKMLSITVGEKEFDKITEKQEIDSPDCLVEMGERFLAVVPHFGKQVTMFIESEKPIKFNETTENLNVTWMIAPLNNKEEKAKKEEEKGATPDA